MIDLIKKNAVVAVESLLACVSGEEQWGLLTRMRMLVVAQGALSVWKGEVYGGGREKWEEVDNVIHSRHVNKATYYYYYYC